MPDENFKLCLKELSLSRTLEARLARANQTASFDERELILGYHRKAPYFAGLSSMLIGGMPNSGKTTIAAYLCSWFVLAGARLEIIDPHLHEHKHGLLNKITPLSPWFAHEPCDFEDMDTVVSRFQHFQAEFVRRKRKDGLIGKQPYVLVIDEVNELLGSFPRTQARTISHAIGDIVRGGRKFGMFVILAAHQWNLANSGGSDVRKNVPLRIATIAEPSELSMILSLDSRIISPYLIPPLQKGHALVYRNGHGLLRLQFPLTTTQECSLIPTIVSPPPSQEMALCINPPVEPAEMETPPSGIVKSEVEMNEQQKYVVQRISEGAGHGTVARELRMSGRRYGQYQQMCAAVGIDTSKPGMTEQEWMQLKATYGNRCARCKRPESPAMQLERDHIIPRSVLGSHIHFPHNTQPLCPACNKLKSNHTITYSPS